MNNKKINSLDLFIIRNGVDEKMEDFKETEKNLIRKISIEKLSKQNFNHYMEKVLESSAEQQKESAEKMTETIKSGNKFQAIQFSKERNF